jgi:membrane protein
MINPASWVIDRLKRINDYIWHTPPAELSNRRLILIKQVRIVILAGRGFLADKVQLRASALTFYSLLSIIPVVAIAFAIAKGFGFDEYLEQLILEKSNLQDRDLIVRMIQIGRDALQKTSGGYIAGIGVLVLFWSVMSLLNRIESSFNDIWQIRISRPWFRKFTDYLTLMLIGPIFLIVSSSVTVFINTEFTEYMAKAPILDFFKPLISFMIQLLPYLLTWLVLTVLFIIMPNTKVKFWSATLAGIISGTFLQLLLWIYFDLQFGLSKLGTLYGSFAALPLFIMLLQSSWIIVLLGAEISFANQNVSRYEFEYSALNISYHQKRALTLLIMNLIVKNFAYGEKPLSSEGISSRLKIPVRLVRDIVQDLNSVHLVSFVHLKSEKERLFQPAMDINLITVSLIFSRLDNKGSGREIVIRNRDYEKITDLLEKLDKLVSKSGSNILVKDL